MTVKMLSLGIVATFYLLTLVGCDSSSTPEQMSSGSQQKTVELSCVKTSADFPDAELISESINLQTKAFKEIKRQITWFEQSEAVISTKFMGMKFKEKVNYWTKFWESMLATYDDHPVKWNYEAVVKTNTMGTVTFCDLNLATLLLSSGMKSFSSIQAQLLDIRLEWIELEKTFFSSSIDQINLRKFRDIKKHEVLNNNPNTFQDWLMELSLGQIFLTRLFATPSQKDQIYSKRKGRISRLREDLIPFWKNIAQFGLKNDTENYAMLHPLRQITDDYAIARINLGTYLGQEESFSYKYILLISWGLNDLFCRSVYLAFLTNDSAWLDISLQIMELQLVSEEATKELLSILRRMMNQR